MKQELLNKINEFKNKIAAEVKRISKMNNKEKYNYVLDLFKENNKNETSKKDDVIFEHQIKDTNPEVIEIINRFKAELGLGLENNDIESVDLSKKDLYTTFLVYIDENNVNGKVPPEVQTLSDLNILKKKRQELLKKALEDGHVYKINSTTYGITRYKGEFNYE